MRAVDDKIRLEKCPAGSRKRAHTNAAYSKLSTVLRDVAGVVRISIPNIGNRLHRVTGRGSGKRVPGLCVGGGGGGGDGRGGGGWSSCHSVLYHSSLTNFAKDASMGNWTTPVRGGVHTSETAKAAHYKQETTPWTMTGANKKAAASMMPTAAGTMVSWERKWQEEFECFDSSDF